MTKKAFWLWLGFILGLSAILRFYQLGVVPHGMTWDEAAIGYNGFALIKNHRDEWLQFLPVSFRSFGDYKAPLAIYINGIFTFVFGLNLWAVRLPFALAGVAAVMGMVLLTSAVLDRSFIDLNLSDRVRKKISLLAGLIMALSPWHLHFSRTGFESGLALSFIIWGMYFLVVAIRPSSHKWLSLFRILISTTMLVASIYAYHSSKIMLPLFALGLLLLWFKKLRQKKVELLFGIFGGLLLLIPFIQDSLYGSGSARFGQTTVFGLNLSQTELIQKIIDNTVIQFSPQFFVGGATTTLRHGDGKWGVLYITDAFLVLVGLIALILSFIQKKRSGWLTYGLLGLSWAISGMAPALVGREVPHPNRTLLALPGLIFLETLGIIYLFNYIVKLTRRIKLVNSHHDKGLLIKYIAGLFLLFYSVLFITYLGDYYRVFAKKSASDFADGYLDTFKYIIPYEYGREGRLETNRIVFTSQYGQPYIFALFSRKTTPMMYHAGSLIKYEFKDIKIGDLQRHNAVVVAGKDELTDIPLERAHKIIYGSDGEVRFKIFVLE